MTAAEQPAVRIGDLAELTGTTPRTIRYYEELGLLPPGEPREAGRHRLYGDRHIERMRELLRLKQLLGLTLEELRELIDAREARAALRDEFNRADDPDRRREILGEALGHLDRQLDLVRRRQAELAELERELCARRRAVRRRLARPSRGTASASRGERATHPT